MNNRNKGYKFSAYGHKNMLAMHKNTLEFTRDKEVSLQGDCILGVGATFSTAQLMKLVRQYNKLRLVISVGRGGGAKREEVLFDTNPNFSDKNEIVIRKSGYDSERTLGFFADKSAKDIDRDIVKMIKSKKTRMNLEIRPQIRLFIFDFDDTLEDFKKAKQAAHTKIAQRIFREKGVYELTVLTLLSKIDKIYSHMGMGKEYWYYDRDMWFQVLFDELGIKINRRDIKKYVSLYWEEIQKNAVLLPGAVSLLKRVSSLASVVIMSDSDGKKSIKMDRF